MDIFHAPESVNAEDSRKREFYRSQNQLLAELFEKNNISPRFQLKLEREVAEGVVFFTKSNEKESSSEIFRNIRVAKINLIYCNAASECFILKEVLRKDIEGKEVSRDYDGISEKVRHEETYEEGAIRGLKEELGLYFDLSELEFVEFYTSSSGGTSNVATNKRIKEFNIRMKTGDPGFKLEGYREVVNGSRISYFEWVPYT